MAKNYKKSSLNRYKNLGNDLFRFHFAWIIGKNLADRTGDPEAFIFDPGKKPEISWLAGLIRSFMNSMYHFPTGNLIDFHLPGALHGP